MSRGGSRRAETKVGIVNRAPGAMTGTVRGTIGAVREVVVFIDLTIDAGWRRFRMGVVGSSPFENAARRGEAGMDLTGGRRYASLVKSMPVKIY